MYTFTINGKLPGLNEYINANRTNRYVGAKMKKETEDRIKLYIKSQIAGFKYGGAVVIRFTWHDTTRRDIDNIEFAKKFILDAMVSEGVIKNDNKTYVKLTIDMFPDDVDVPMIVVEVIPVEELTDEQKRVYKVK